MFICESDYEHYLQSLNYSNTIHTNALLYRFQLTDLTITNSKSCKELENTFKSFPKLLHECNRNL